MKSTSPTWKSTAILVGIPALLAAVLFGVFGFNGYYGQDSHEYLRFATAWKASGFDPEVLAGFHWPVGFPVAGILLSYAGIPLKWALVFVSFASACGVLLLLQKIIQRLYKADGTWWLVLAAATQVYFIRGGILAMSDMLCCFLVLLTYYNYLRYRDQAHWRFMAYLCWAAAAAFFTRYAAIPLLSPPLIAGFWLFFRRESVALKISAALLLTGLLELVIWSGDRFYAVASEIVQQWNETNILALQAEEESGILTRTVPNGLYIFGSFFHLGFLSIGVLLLPFYRKISREKVLWIGGALYLLLLVGLSTQNYRFLILLHPLSLILLFPAFQGLQHWLKTRRIFGIFAICVLVFNTVFFAYSFRKTYAVYAAERAVATALLEMKSDAPIYSFYVDQSFATYGLTNEVRNLYTERYEEFEQGALVVYNPEAFEDQWVGTSVGENWEKLCESEELDTLQTVYGNWKIYRIR